MKNSERFTSSLTEIYANLVIQLVQSQNPHFNPGKAKIDYDEDNECYVYSGFTDYEMRCVNNALPELMNKTFGVHH